ncbi:hypothetical protein [Actinomyces weissii]|uniref:Uncharacterized protein n=1 Tax=Actinomyces weissii TaxID=675090 RepID=A0A7T7S2I5_9ACTO|nr:hypothetical protein [Actinomyces weissii]QQM67647.1 hypothetical protein JG540_01815 [Actinomyces weissii]
MLETNGNQRYIFSSPRLRENIGASAQLSRLKDWVTTAVRSCGADKGWPEERPELCPTGSAADKADSSTPASLLTRQWVSRSSGKVIFMVETEEQAQQVIGHVTRTVLAQAPGLDLSGVYISMGDKKTVDRQLLEEVHAEASRYALNRPPAEARFSQMPFLAQAKDSNLPAAPPLDIRDEANDDKATPHSLPSRVKRYQAYQSRTRLAGLASGQSELLAELKKGSKLALNPTELANALKQELTQAFNPSSTVPEQDAQGSSQDLRDLEKRFEDERYPSAPPVPDELQGAQDAPLSKVAVIHIDGNGVGAIMLNLDLAMQRVAPEDFKTATGCERKDSDATRCFVLAVSQRLDQAVTAAFAQAWADVARWASANPADPAAGFQVAPVVPVILGGDDVTVITSGDYALPFAASFLKHFEQNTGADVLLRHLHAVGQESVTGPGPMTAAAGVAIVRRNFPFHVAYDLAERLVKRAKGVGKAQQPTCSTLDYHVLFDTTVLEPAELLASYKGFTTRPFRLQPEPATGSPAEPSPATGSPAEHSPTGASTPEDGPQYATWDSVCRRTARFKGFRDAQDQADQILPFPHTRAARIRKLLSDAEQSGSQSEQAETLRQVDAQWEDAKKEVRANLDTELGGPHTLYDLLELGELLPDSFLSEATKLAPPVQSASRNTRTSTEAQS